MLAGNIGYVKFDGFAEAATCGLTVVAAMGFVAHAGALIFDLRENGGARFHLPVRQAPPTSTTCGSAKGISPSSTGHCPMFRASAWNTPVYVLPSSRTFSGAGEFSDNLKNLKRATVVGETTGGGAHPVSGHRLDDRFSIGVPFARAINPISKTNCGVEPDVKPPQGEALAVALTRGRSWRASSRRAPGSTAPAWDLAPRTRAADSSYSSLADATAVLFCPVTSSQVCALRAVRQ